MFPRHQASVEQRRDHINYLKIFGLNIIFEDFSNLKIFDESRDFGEFQKFGNDFFQPFRKTELKHIFAICKRILTQLLQVNTDLKAFGRISISARERAR